MMDRLKKFDATSADIENYNDELHLQYRLMRQAKPFSEQQKLVIQQQEFIMQQMSKNNVRPNSQTHALLFAVHVSDGQLGLAN